MLILTRKAGESIILGDGESKITVQVLATQNGQVRLGVSAPKEVPVHREEIYLKIHSGESSDSKVVVKSVTKSVDGARRPAPKATAASNPAMALAFAKADPKE